MIKCISLKIAWIGLVPRILAIYSSYGSRASSVPTAVAMHRFHIVMVKSAHGSSCILHICAYNRHSPSRNDAGSTLSLGRIHLHSIYLRKPYLPSINRISGVIPDNRLCCLRSILRSYSTLLLEVGIKGSTLRRHCHTVRVEIEYVPRERRSYDHEKDR